MSINATTSSISSSSSVSQMSSTGSSESTKSKSDSSFKDEMDKVSSTEKSKDTKDTKEVEKKDTDKTVTDKKSDKEQKSDEELLEANVDYSDFGSQSILDANSMLANDIQQMMRNVNGVYQSSEIDFNNNNFRIFDYTNTLSMTQSDAEFFLNLTQNNEVSAQGITAQAQMMLQNGADVQEVFQSSKISQTLLNAINDARQNNQPLRIDFDQNISVILRFGKNGSLAANFIPGDKAVEQYLRNNIESLKATFDENKLPYSDLSYQSRGSKQQKEQRRSKQQS